MDVAHQVVVFLFSQDFVGVRHFDVISLKFEFSLIYSI